MGPIVSGGLTRIASSLTRPPGGTRILLLNALIVVLVILIGGLLYALLARQLLRRPVEVARAGSGTGVIQIDVLNGCGASGAATGVTNYLRSRGYDVVEQRNYRTFDINASMVIDRTGERKNAERVAYALGIRNENIVQQINPDYFVDVSVLIGKDYKSLKPSQ